MKIFMIGLFALTSVAASAKTNPNGPGMYCALDAQAQAELRTAETISLDPEQGILFKTTIGSQAFYIIETAKDGSCVTEYVKEI